MKVNGTEITAGQIEACERAMQAHTFSLGNIMNAAKINGIDDASGAGSTAGRLADRLIQKARKRGEIEYRDGEWFRIKSPNA